MPCVHHSVIAHFWQNGQNLGLIICLFVICGQKADKQSNYRGEKTQNEEGIRQKAKHAKRCRNNRGIVVKSLEDSRYRFIIKRAIL